MATFVGRINDRQIVLIVTVSISGIPGGNLHQYSGLLDTGAQATMISKKVIDEVGLTAIGHMSIIPVTGEPSLTGKYRIRLDIPIESQVKLPDGGIGQHNVMRGMDLEVGALTYEPTNHDVLLGMDFISAFHITMYGDSFILSN